jgi:transcriptional regulator with XRE-family HTH domain
MRLEDFLRYGERRTFAEKVGCSKSNIDRICCGTHSPSQALALRIVEACKDKVGNETVRLTDLPGYSTDYPARKPKRKKKDPEGQETAAG